MNDMERRAICIVCIAAALHGKDLSVHRQRRAEVTNRHREINGWVGHGEQASRWGKKHATRQIKERRRDGRKNGWVHVNRSFCIRNRCWCSSSPGWLMLQKVECLNYGCWVYKLLSIHRENLLFVVLWLFHLLLVHLFYKSRVVCLSCFSWYPRLPFPTAEICSSSRCPSVSRWVMNLK